MKKVFLRDKMTAIELVHTIEQLDSLSAELLTALANACGECNKCGSLYGEMEGTPKDWVKDCVLCRDAMDKGDRIHIPDYLLEGAGIPPDAKLTAYSDEESGVITIEQADKEYDVSDVPDNILEQLVDRGICLTALDELIQLEAVIYG